MRVEYEVGYRDRFVFNLTHQFLVAAILFVGMWIAQAVFLAIVLITRRSDTVLTQHQHSALIIPSRAFPSGQVRKQFVDLIKKNMHGN